MMDIPEDWGNATRDLALAYFAAEDEGLTHDQIVVKIQPFVDEYERLAEKYVDVPVA